MHGKLSCIIPAHNEAPRIAAVLRAVVGHPLIDEVIVVDDGSTDGTTGVVAAQPGVKLVALAQNGGKTAAIAAGLRAARHDLVLFVDSDLSGLEPAHLTALIVPVLRGRADVAVSLRGNAPLPWRLIGLDYISGERVVPRALLPAPDTMAALPRFGLEVAMNEGWIAAQAKIAVVPWPAVDSPFKHAKRGLAAGLRAELAMLRDIFTTVSPWRAGWQIWRMWRQSQRMPVQGALGQVRAVSMHDT